MKNKIKEILEKNYTNKGLDLQVATDQLFDLFSVSQQRELLVAYEKQHYTPSEWALASKQCEKEIDQLLATNCG